MKYYILLTLFSLSAIAQYGESITDIKKVHKGKWANSGKRPSKDSKQVVQIYYFQFAKDHTIHYGVNHKGTVIDISLRHDLNLQIEKSVNHKFQQILEKGEWKEKRITNTSPSGKIMNLKMDKSIYFFEFN